MAEQGDHRAPREGARQDRGRAEDRRRDAHGRARRPSRSSRRSSARSRQSRRPPTRRAWPSEETIALLEKELGKIAAEQKTADETRMAEKEAWGAAKSDFEQGLEGVQMALEVLRDYYAEKDDAALLQGAQSDLGDAMSLAQKSTGAASGIIGMLEVAESDFSKMLAEGQATEDLAQSEYEALTEDNEVLTAEKTTAVKYKGKDKKETEAFLSETKDDLGTTQEELDAVLEYYDKLKPQCIAKPEPYAERKKRREKEIAGLKEALDILEAESA